MNATLRSKEDKAAYTDYLQKNDSNSETLSHLPSLYEWEHWRLVKNTFPYSKIAAKHDMLLPKIPVRAMRDLSPDAYAELLNIKDKLTAAKTYNFFLETMKGRSIQGILHFHLITIYERDEDFKF